MLVSIQAPEDGDWQILDDYDTGMGSNSDNIEDEILDEVEEFADDLGLEYNPSEEDYEVFFNEDESRAILYAKSWSGAMKTIAEATAFSCDLGIRGGDMRPKGRTVKPGEDTVKVNESVLRGAARYLEEKETGNVSW